MSGKTATPEQVAEAIALRAAGLSLVGIAQRVDLSPSTVQRILRRHPTAKGHAAAELAEATKRELLQRVTCDDVIRNELARLIADDIHHAAMLRTKAAIVAEHLEPKNLAEAAVAMRALVAWSTLLVNTTATIRRTMPFDKATPETADELPELVVRVMTDDEVRAIRDTARHRRVEGDDGMTGS